MYQNPDRPAPDYREDRMFQGPELTAARSMMLFTAQSHSTDSRKAGKFA